MNSRLTVVVSVVMLTITGTAAVVGLSLGAQDTESAAVMSAAVLGFLSTNIGILITLAKSEQTDRKVDRVLNGEMDAKFKSDMDEVLSDRNLGDDTGKEYNDER